MQQKISLLLLQANHLSDHFFLSLIEGGCLWVATSQHVSSASWIWHHSSFASGFIAACNSAAASSVTAGPDMVMSDYHYYYSLYYWCGHYLQPERRGWEGQRLDSQGCLFHLHTQHTCWHLLRQKRDKLTTRMKLEIHLLLHCPKCFLISNLCIPNVFWLNSVSKL